MTWMSAPLTQAVLQHYSTPSMSWQCNVKVIAQALTSPFVCLSVWCMVYPITEYGPEHCLLCLVYHVNVILVMTLLVWSVLSVLYISNP